MVANRLFFKMPINRVLLKDANNFFTAGNVSGAGHVQTCLRAGLVSGPDLSQGQTCLRAGLVLTCLRAGLVLTCLRARLVSGPDLSRAPGLEMSRAGSVSRPDLV